MSTKKAVLNSEIQRAMRVSSDQHAEERSLRIVSELFMLSNYPRDVIMRIIRTNKHKSSHKNRRFNSNTGSDNTAHIYMRLPYINETVVRRVNGIIRSSKAPIMPVWVNENSV